MYGFYYGLTEGGEKAVVADIAPPDARGPRSASYHAVLGIGALAASLVFGSSGSVAALRPRSRSAPCSHLSRVALSLLSTCNAVRAAPGVAARSGALVAYNEMVPMKRILVTNDDGVRSEGSDGARGRAASSSAT